MPDRSSSSGSAGLSLWGLLLAGLYVVISLEYPAGSDKKNDRSLSSSPDSVFSDSSIVSTFTPNDLPRTASFPETFNTIYRSHAPNNTFVYVPSEFHEFEFIHNLPSGFYGVKLHDQYDVKHMFMVPGSEDVLSELINHKLAGIPSEDRLEKRVASIQQPASSQEIIPGMKILAEMTVQNYN